ncbi:DNA ligase-like protein isoform X2 [Tasmannia lanceolata]|uniref:DNA ligase-like protein isoform X2 n=1 Tax=Tasmannia lanceolata TaxID=3420 RepID=UPI0040636E21
MEGDNCDLIFSPVEEIPSPIHERKLKRLRKTAQISNPSLFEIPDSSPLISISDPKTLDMEKSVDSISLVFGSETLVEREESVDKFDDLFVESRKSSDHDDDVAVDPISLVSGSWILEEGAESMTEFDDLFAESRKCSDPVVELFDESNEGFEEGDVGGIELWGKVNDLKVKKRRSLEGGKGNDEKNKKKKKGKSVDDDGKHEVSEREIRKLDKERKAHLELTHVESQRLLRETRDASFKPVPTVQKPISSVLEKIRRRKLEVSKRSVISDVSDCLADSGASLRNITQDFEQNTENEVRKDGENIEEDKGVHALDTERCVKGAAHDGSGGSGTIFDHCESIPSNTASDEMCQDASRTPINVKKDLFCQSQLSDTEDNQHEDDVDSPQEDDFTPSVLAKDLKHDSVSSDNDSSCDEDDDKENIEPHSHKQFDDVLYPKGDPVKAFVDDEAEEEDDSDNDLMRFRESDDEEENVENEKLDDLIATGYKEMPIDSERREELHQKWLEQQDAAATDNVMQLLKCGRKQRDVTMLYNEEDDEKFDEISEDEHVDNHLPTREAHKNSIKVKQMIAQVFTDGEDVFLSSDEETDQMLVRQRLLEETEEQASFLSPLEDESSREVFGLIKKLNIAPSTKKRPKPTSSYFDTLVTGGNSNSSSKSSFLGRGASNSLPSLHKKGSSTFKSFIFGRDDSNSRSGISTSELSSDMELKENQPTRNVSAKFSNSQSKLFNHNKKIEAGKSSGSSLFEILRHSSMNSDNHVQTEKLNDSYLIGPSQAIHQFSAFKSVKKVMKMER